MGPRSFSLKTSGAYADLDQVRDTVVGAVDGRSVRVRDVAKVRWDEGQLGPHRPLQRQARRVRHART